MGTVTQPPFKQDEEYEQENREPLFSQEELEADFEMAMDMMEFGLKNQDKDNFDLLSEFKKSKYKSAKRLASW